MMNFVGNFETWINPEWLDFLKNNRGMGRPLEGKKFESCEDTEKVHREVGYNTNSISFWMFDYSNFPFKIDPPWIQNAEEKFNDRAAGTPFHWWITKLLPGNFMPMHVDPHQIFQDKTKRYWVPLTDWQDGHIFLCEDFVPTKYKAGDVWTYSADALHGAVNLGITERYVLHIATHGY